MTEFWEGTFQRDQELWGSEPAKSTVLTHELFVEQKVKKVLILGIGYGRNAKIFKDSGMNVSGIEISKTAIELARKHFGNDLIIYHGSVEEMPFDTEKYDGIYAYALIHFLDKEERAKLLQDCHDQLAENGFMVFATVSKEAQLHGKGTCIGKDRFELSPGLKMFFYDRDTIHEEFSKFGLFDIIDVRDVYPFHLIKCKKENSATEVAS